MTNKRSHPSLSVITVCYNSAATLSHTLLSVESQVVGVVDHLVIDGGSRDGSLDIIRASTHISRFVSESDLGAFDAMNKGIGLAGGEVIGILNADDVYASPNVLAKVISVFEDPDIDSCYGDLVYVDSIDTDRVVRYWHSGDFKPRRFYWGWMPPHPTFFVRKSVYNRFGLYNLDLGSAADYELMLRFLVRHKIKTAYIPEVLVRMRIGGMSNFSWKNRLRANQMDRRAWAVNELRPFPWTLWLKPLRKLTQWVFR